MDKIDLNKVSDKLTYHKDSLDHYLMRYEKYLEHKNSWQVWLSIVITLVVTFISSKTGWMQIRSPYEAIFYTAFVVFVVLLVRSLYKAYQSKDPASELRTLLFSKYINKPDVNFIFIIKQKGSDRFLVYRCKTWGCYFLPYVGVRDGASLPDDKLLTRQISDSLNFLENEISVQKLLDSRVKTEKYHPQECLVKEYHTHYYHLFAKNNFSQEDIYVSDPYIVGSKAYEWKTLEELESDERTVEKNGDVLRVIRDNKTDFILNTSSLS